MNSADVENHASKFNFRVNIYPVTAERHLKRDGSCFRNNRYDSRYQGPAMHYVVQIKQDTRKSCCGISPKLICPLGVDPVDPPLVQVDQEHQVISEHRQPMQRGHLDDKGE